MSAIGRDHPRMCGEHRILKCWAAPFMGSSPHVRGAPRDPLGQHVRTVIIPACAGSTGLLHVKHSRNGDHPRMCGEHLPLKNIPGTAPGSSPHVRGAHNTHHASGDSAGIIPACAGSTPSQRFPHSPQRDHPRMCGEHNLGNVRVSFG